MNAQKTLESILAGSRNVNFSDLVKLVEAYGFQLSRIQGSHHIYGKAGSVARVSRPVHGNKPLKIGLLKHLLKMAGLQESDLE